MSEGDIPIGLGDCPVSLLFKEKGWEIPIFAWTEKNTRDFVSGLLLMRKRELVHTIIATAKWLSGMDFYLGHKQGGLESIVSTLKVVEERGKTKDDDKVERYVNQALALFIKDLRRQKKGS